MPKDTKTLGNNKARACESLGFVHKKRLCQRFDTTSLLYDLGYYSLAWIAFDSSSYPGLFSKANIFFLYASTPGWLNGFTPSR